MSKIPPRCRITLISQREVTPAWVNALSLPDNIQAQLYIDVDDQSAKGANKEREQFKFIWRPEVYSGFSRDRIRKRFYLI